MIVKFKPCDRPRSQTYLKKSMICRAISDSVTYHTFNIISGISDVLSKHPGYQAETSALTVTLT